MIIAIVKQRDMYRVLLAQSNIKILEGNAANSLGAQDSAVLIERPSSCHGSVDVGVESKKLREVQMELDDYKMEKQANVKLLLEAMEQERSKCSELLIANIRAQSLVVEKDSAVREAEFLRKNEEILHAELTTLRLDNTNLLNLMESTRRMESAREERERREQKKIVTLETNLHDAYEKIDVKELTCGAQAVAADREKQAAVDELTKLKERHSQMNEQHGRPEEQKKALEEKTVLLEKETTQLRDTLRKGAGVAASERMAALEV
ncbi:hypothetical protein PsorP6_009470 [Peronosclerospora sorghi]|uniref:Uncharacterized protein n=1 Tax=Peronosclerospora sorghi TaxID=230839 RepID=A0ACC0W256_9STRA|nr:hypothetical protein PsorP6_009470 [Peronosclerospora sorghi]